MNNSNGNTTVRLSREIDSYVIVLSNVARLNKGVYCSACSAHLSPSESYYKSTHGNLCVHCYADLCKLGGATMIPLHQRHTNAHKIRR